MLRLKENFLQTICLCRNLGNFDSPCEKHAGISLIHSYVTLFEHTTCVTSKKKKCCLCNLSYREYWQFDDAIIQHSLDMKAELVFFFLFFFLHGARTWRVLTAPLWTLSLPSSLSPDIYHSLQLPLLTNIKHLLATYAHLINVYSTL